MESLTLAGDIVQVDQSVVFDSGTSYSYLPLHVFQWLTKKLNGTVDDMGRYIYPRAQPDSGKLLRFKFKHGSYDFPLLWLLDFGLPPNATIHGQPAAWDLFKAGSPSRVHSTDESHRQMPCILGNSFLRGMLVEFEHKGIPATLAFLGISEWLPSC
ncbi:hypothetical protein B0H10DRAFT_657208 [Mycena sp. CBHHK59/15]|nr:hypothetical protein B0H10DRAFT_657208 [Mycena sp. CBHHK59/15]